VKMEEEHIEPTGHEDDIVDKNTGQNRVPGRTPIIDESQDTNKANAASRNFEYRDLSNNNVVAISFKANDDNLKVIDVEIDCEPQNNSNVVEVAVAKRKPKKVEVPRMMAKPPKKAKGSSKPLADQESSSKKASVKEKEAAKDSKMNSNQKVKKKKQANVAATK
jgi:hypothetical protein